MTANLLATSTQCMAYAHAVPAEVGLLLLMSKSCY